MRKAIGIALSTFVLSMFLNMFFTNAMPNYAWAYLGINCNLFFISFFIGIECIRKERL